MHNKNLKKLLGIGITLLIFLSTFTSITTGLTENQTLELSSQSKPHPNTKKAIVTCTTYGFDHIETTHKTTLTQTQAEQILEKINTYATLIAQNPQSTETNTLQEEILTLAATYNLIPPNTLAAIKNIPTPPQRLLPKFTLAPQSTADEWFCNYAAGGEGSSTPVIILPRLIPILLTPIPRVLYRWSCQTGFSSCGGLRSKTGFMAAGEQTGTALGFWGIGFSIFLPPVMAFGIIGYALYCRVSAEQIELWPPNYPPEINAVYPLNNALNIPIATTELSFHIDDIENEPMSYSVTTQPDIGSGNGNQKPDGTYTIPISGLEGTETYTWIVTVTDGPNTVEKTFHFSTEPVAPIVENPTPKDGEQYIPISLSELRVHISDPQGDTMDYTIETSPNIGSGGNTGVNAGQVSIPVNNLEYMTEYIWYINVTDGTHWKHKSYTFQTEPLMIFNPHDYGWTYRKNITINHTHVAGDHTNIPILLKTIDPDLPQKAQADGDDILFMDYEGTANRLYHEIESYNHSNGELIAWINMTTLTKAADTSLIMYYGNPTASTQQHPIKVWNQHYMAVWHLDNLQDSTLHDNDGQANGAQITTSKIGKGRYFDGDNDVITVSNAPSLNFKDENEFTISLWINSQGTQHGQSETIISKGTTSTDQGYNCVLNRTGHPGFAIRDGNNGHSLYSTNPILQNTYHHLTFIWTGTSLQIYKNGILENTVTLGPIQLINDNKPFDIAEHYNKFNFHGYFDEIQVSNHVLNETWIKTSYNNQHNPNAFYFIGPEET